MAYDQYEVFFWSLLALLVLNVGLWIKLSNLRDTLWDMKRKIEKLQDHVNYLQDGLITTILGDKE